MSKFNVGDKVVFLGTDTKYSSFYPSIGTIGVVDMIGYESCRCKWPEENPGKNGIEEYTWWVKNANIELVTEKEKKMTNEEIWEMLKPKMEKNGLWSSHFSTIPFNYLYEHPNMRWYSENEVHNAIAIAYRSGYERAMKGRPFKFGGKKKKGHWEPVDPSNLPKEGTKVRYSRECKVYSDYKVPIIVLGDLGKVDITTEGWFGIVPENPRSSFRWVSFDGRAASCLDMWVEDDE